LAYERFYLFSHPMRLLSLLFMLFVLPVLGSAQNDSAVVSPAEIDFCQDSLLLSWAERYALHPGMIENPRLVHLFEDWKGTPYRYGGSSRKGIDCSGFVSMLYDSVYKALLLGGSADIFRKLAPIEKEELREGDLVFFRIQKKRISHVGLYLSNDKFIHATTRGGVMMSDLKEPYYRRYYYKAARMPEPVFESNSD